MANEQSALVTPQSFRRALLAGTLLVVVDALYINQGLIAGLIVFWLLLGGLPLTFLAKKYVTVRAHRFRNQAIYFVAAIIVFALNAANNQLAQSRGEALVSDIKAFHVRNERYPKSLEELVPDYVESVPLAKYTFGFNEFRYFVSDHSVLLFYTHFPPFGRPTYSFDRDEWVYVD
jgi:hypothetical protein